MNTAMFLEIMSLQRHDFLNHMQVISGLVQLNKIDKVKEYINQVSLIFEKQSKVSHLSLPEVSAVLLIVQYLADKHQIEILCDINTKLVDCAIPGKVLGNALEEILEQSLEYLLPLGLTDRSLKISITESEKKYLFKISFSKPPHWEEDTAQKKVAMVANKVLSYGIKIGIAVSDHWIEIFLVFPRRLPDQGVFGT